MADNQEFSAVHFYPKLDIILLREIYSQDIDPTQAGDREAWLTIHKNINSTLLEQKKSVTLRQCRDRAKCLLKKYRASEMESLKSSGVEEEYDERNVLLEEIVTMSKELSKESKPTTEKQKEKEKEKQGKFIRDAAMKALKANAEEATGAIGHVGEDVDDQDDADTPRKKKLKKKESVLSFMEEKFSVDADIRRDEIALQREKLELDSKKLELECKKQEGESRKFDGMIWTS